MIRFILDLLILLTCLPCLKGGRSFVIQPQSWDFRGHDIGYEVAQRISDSTMGGKNDISGIVLDNDDDTKLNTMMEADVEKSKMIKPDVAKDVPSTTKDPILLLNGFGVGSFHQHRLIERLFQSDSVDGQENNNIVYGLDYLGQGRSWPRDCNDGTSDNENGLRYCADMWVDQIIAFIEEVIIPEHSTNSDGKLKVHIVGNSVGGHLAAHIANRRPDLVSSICLLNPTPVWGLNLPGWSGHLPAPKIPKAIGRYLFDRIRDLNTIEKYLQNAYSQRDAFDENLMNQIRGCTLGKGGHAAFASILFSPPLMIEEHIKGNFQDCLARVQCDVLLIFGKDDPWCKPAFAKTMLEALDQREPEKIHRYVEISNCGHCPNHEAPQAVAKIIKNWTQSEDRNKQILRLLDETDKQIFEEEWGKMVAQERQGDDIELSWLDRLAVTFV